VPPLIERPLHREFCSPTYHGDISVVAAPESWLPSTVPTAPRAPGALAPNSAYLEDVSDRARTGYDRHRTERRSAAVAVDLVVRICSDLYRPNCTATCRLVEALFTRNSRPYVPVSFQSRGVFTMNNRPLSILSTAVAMTAFLAIGIGATPATVAGAAIGSTPMRSFTSNMRTVNLRPDVAKMSTIHTTKTMVSGKSQTILVNSKGQPLYYYAADTAKKSFVNGQLARLWPPLLTTHPTATGARGVLTSMKVPAGQQVTYNGHFLYTFIEDAPGRVSGQGVSNFFVASPRLKVIGSAVKVNSPKPPTSGGYQY
jgi:predicted lipoprotein with Yx(FWY)xxD motif